MSKTLIQSQYLKKTFSRHDKVRLHFFNTKHLSFKTHSCSIDVYDHDVALKRSAGSSPPAQTASSLSRESIRALDPNTRFAFSDSPGERDNNACVYFNDCYCCGGGGVCVASSFSAFPIASGARKRTVWFKNDLCNSRKKMNVFFLKKNVAWRWRQWPTIQ